MQWFFLFFLISGFCSLVYQVVWLRLSMAEFGVTTMVTSMVLSVFMLGLALGSWLSGRLSTRLKTPESAKLRCRPLEAYGLAEILIGISGIAVPVLLGLGGRLVATVGHAAAWGSTSFYCLSGAWLILVLLPFCTAMGATFPLAMEAIRELHGDHSKDSFSYLYLANVIGALVGTLTSAFILIELYGFRRTSFIAASLNILLGVTAFAISRTQKRAQVQPKNQTTDTDTPRIELTPVEGAKGALWFLFATGLVSLALEVVWTRQFTPFLGTIVYAFASVLALYLAGTFLGTKLYRKWITTHQLPSLDILLGYGSVVVGALILVPLFSADPRAPFPSSFFGALLRVIVGVVPFCMALGFLTPCLVDVWSGGRSDRAGSAYAVNVLGCILGPLLAGFILLPRISEVASLTLLCTAPISILLFVYLYRSVAKPKINAKIRKVCLGLGSVLALAGLLVFSTRSFESLFLNGVVKRDNTATVIAHGTGFKKGLLVNGWGMTVLTPISKIMAHLPLASLPHQPQEGLVICFGMGTSFRSMASWGIQTTGVELIPSVPSLFGYYHADGPELLRSPKVEVVVDDGRRFLLWTKRTYDVITIDPPPPVEAAGSSLLYSREFYTLAKSRLKPGGILQQWFPGGDATTEASVLAAIRDAFPHVRVFRGVQDWGFHMLASDQPIARLSAEELAGRLPASASRDLMEWFPRNTVTEVYAAMLSREMNAESILGKAPNAPMMRDDRPVNEYYFLRREMKGQASLP